MLHLKEEEEGKEEEEEEIEALSLCDLPVNLIGHEDQSKAKPDSQINETQEEDFDFRLWSGPFSTEPEMCAADEVFFQGQILPLHLSLKRCESLDHVSVREFCSNSSSSSIRSQNSSSSSSSTTTTTTPIISETRIQNQNQNHFLTHPSPQRQLKVTVPRQTSFGNHGRKSSAWDFLRLGVVPAPEIALQDLKVRSTNGVNKNHTARSNSMGSNNSNANANGTVKTSYSGKTKNHVFKKIGGFWSGCKYSVETVQQSDMVMIKGGTKSANTTESATHAAKEKVLERKRQKHRQKQGKRTMSRRRTFEWIKELSHVSYPDEEALLS
ncbi:hypothetical protein HKD37_11G030546 [Glycine soja]|nr:hypothetical protein JHK85_030743 [Glycine max]KAH1223703.1 hypothetical protein GmHk_11G031109 [Glycine max]